MKTSETRLYDLMTAEIELLEEFGQREQELKEILHRNDWDSLSNLIKDLAPLTERIDELETRRHEEFAELRRKLGEGPNTGFYHVIVHLPEAERDRYFRLYRRLKMTVLKIQGITWGIDTYIRTVTGTMNQLLNEMFPFRKGTLYGRDGCEKKRLFPEPMVVSRTL
jgi:hypothetical protein